MATVTRVGRTESGWLAVEVDFGDHQNDFLFPDTEDSEVIYRVIRDWHEHHEASGDQRGNNIVIELPGHHLLGEVPPVRPPVPVVVPPADEFGRLLEYDVPDE